MENINEILDGQPEEIECFICNRDFQPVQGSSPICLECRSWAANKGIGQLILTGLINTMKGVE